MESAMVQLQHPLINEPEIGTYSIFVKMDQVYQGTTFGVREYGMNV